MKRSQFTFYRSFYEALRTLPKSARLAAYEAITAYALDGEAPELHGAAATAFLLVKPVLDSARAKAKAGKLGADALQANRRQTAGAAPAEPGQSSGEGEKETEAEKEKKKEIESEAEGEKEGQRPLSPPAREQEGPDFETVRREARQRGCEELARPFFDYYAAAGWRDREGRPVRSWKQKLVLWQERESKGGFSGPRRAAPVVRESPDAPRKDMDRMERYLRKLREAEDAEAG